MSVRTVYSVEVPMVSTDRGRSGSHVFTGHADDARQALEAARAAWHRAQEHLAAGRDVPRAAGFGWSARGVRAGWSPDWGRATARPRSPGSLAASFGTPR
ncbi:hypothetical protein [Streptomyces sp. NPDC097619]|uniref:hypothetical protein n=1 Tax=Streptomyces sp. NPDC097619 TaxID=3157228 RepID=UPI003322889C